MCSNKIRILDCFLIHLYNKLFRFKISNNYIYIYIDIFCLLKNELYIIYIYITERNFINAKCL